MKSLRPAALLFSFLVQLSSTYNDAAFFVATHLPDGTS